MFGVEVLLRYDYMMTWGPAFGKGLACKGLWST